MKKYFTLTCKHLTEVPIYTSERILISPDVMIIAQCDKCVCVWCDTHAFDVLRENTPCAHDITYTGHYEKSVTLRDNDSHCYLHKMKIISSDLIALLRRLLMCDTCTCWAFCWPVTYTLISLLLGPVCNWREKKSDYPTDDHVKKIGYPPKFLAIGKKVVDDIISQNLRRTWSYFYCL